MRAFRIPKVLASFHANNEFPLILLEKLDYRGRSEATVEHQHRLGMNNSFEMLEGDNDEYIL